MNLQKIKEKFNQKGFVVVKKVFDKNTINRILSELDEVKIKAEKTKKMFLCACKQTNNQPFCDGSHNK